VSPLDFAGAHPWTSLVLVLVLGRAVAGIVAAAVAPLQSWRRPGDCPRCRGTGRDPA
jgi:hypothetical protein